MSNQKGMTLFEVTIVLSVASVVLAATATYALPWVARERARTAVYDVQSYLQLARIEAVSRNHDVRFVLDTATRTAQVLDTNGTPGTTSDDILLYRTNLPEQSSFALPGTGAPVTLSAVGGSVYQTVFTSDGIVASGTGQVSMYGGDEYCRVMVYGAGGVVVERWDGSRWAGSHGSVARSGGTNGDGGTNGGGETIVGGETTGGGELPGGDTSTGGTGYDQTY